MRRAIQTAVLAFGECLNRDGIEFHLVPEAQEVSGMPCNIGLPRAILEGEVQKLFEGDKDAMKVIGKIEYGAVVEGWNSKEGIWSTDKTAVEKRAAKLRAWLYTRHEKHIVLVTHGAFLHYSDTNN
ncbi:hypothetical protein LSUE1_G010070 [Lachnellula suecica]|uniref:Phosphoglycerate mutase n=1 Tax=Lachnellula suecica TaxID=602035 RepID=A0A8T9BQM1_9HELO|nr:hypothetical protein LSUE1_G010070 [Lachnellula suecica]